MTVRLRLRELMRKRGFTSAYQLAQALDDNIGEATVYRLVKADGVIESVKAEHLEALAEVFGCDVPDLFERRKR